MNRSLRILLVPILLVAVAGAVACSTNDANEGTGTTDTPPPPPGPGPSTSENVGTSGGVIEMDGVKLVVPPGAVPDGTVITITETSDPPPDGYDALSPTFAFGPDGLSFAQAATIEMSITATDGSDAVVLWSLAGGSGFEELPTTLAAAGRYSAPVAHFSRGLVGRRHHAQGNDSGATDSGGDGAATDSGIDGGGDGGACAPYGGTCSIATVNPKPCCNNVQCVHVIDDAGSRYMCLTGA